MHAATYRRVSSKAQAREDRHSLRAQSENIERLCMVTEVSKRQDFSDDGVSAWTNDLAKLPGLTALLKYLAEHKPDGIVIGADVDRLIGRKGGLQAKVFEALAENKVK